MPTKNTTPTAANVAVGQLLKGRDGKWYEVATIEQRRSPEMGTFVSVQAYRQGMHCGRPARCGHSFAFPVA